MSKSPLKKYSIKQTSFDYKQNINEMQNDIKM